VKSSWPSIKDAHPNEYIHEGFDVIACRMCRPISRIATKDVDRHKWYCSLYKIDEQREERLGSTYGAVTGNCGKSLIQNSCIVKINEEATAYKASSNLFAPFSIPVPKLLLSCPLLSAVTSYTTAGLRMIEGFTGSMGLALRNITKIHHGIIDTNVAMENVIFFKECSVSC